MSGWGGRWGHHPDSMTGRFEAEQAAQRFARVEEVMEQKRRAQPLLPPIIDRDPGDEA